MTTQKIKNLLFDLGGVIMDIERDRCVAAFVALGMKHEDVDNMLGLYLQSGTFLQLEEGHINPAQFRDWVRTQIPRVLSDADIDGALNEFLIGIPVHRLISLRELRKEYNIYMLSNTNAIMYNSKIADAFKAEGLVREDYFDGVSLSFEAKCSKPDAEIFKYTIDKLGINPTETLFFDDSQKNLDAAAKFGFHTSLVAPGTEFIDYFKQ